MKIEKEDLQRLAVELRESDGGSLMVWAEKNGFTKDTVVDVSSDMLDDFSTVVSKQVKEKLMERIRGIIEEGEDSDPDMVQIAPGLFLGEGNLGEDVDIPAILRFSFFTCFALGFEAHKQYGERK